MTTKDQIQTDALCRAVSNQSLTNWPAIFNGFIAKGIPETDIRPRENVFTYHAWRALGRQIRRGEHGVKVTTFVPMKDKQAFDDNPDAKDKPKRGASRPWTATVFHISQTDPIQA